MMQTSANPSPIRTTNSTIALVNLDARIAGHDLVALTSQLSDALLAERIDLLLLRGQILGRIGDCERALALAEDRVRHTPVDGLARLALCRAHGCFHRFDEALADLDEAERLGLRSREVVAERASILQATGRYAEAFELRQAAVQRHGDFNGFWGLASLYAERGDVDAAEPLFDRAIGAFRGVSPFGLGQLEFERGRMWLEHGDACSARQWLMKAWLRLPAWVQAEGHLAEAEAATGDAAAAISRLRRLASVSEDPDYAAQLARILTETGRREEATRWRDFAARRYDEFMKRHPAAFADHAAEFWASVGGDPRRAIGFARTNLQYRKTPRALALLSRAVAALRAKYA